MTIQTERRDQTVTATEEDDGHTRRLEIIVRDVPSDEPFVERDELIEAEKRSAEFWESIDDEHRLALAAILRDALLRLVDDPDSWLPTTIEPAEGQRIDLRILIHLSDLDQDVLKRRVDVEREVQRTRQDLIELRDETAPSEAASDGEAPPDPEVT